MRTVAIVQARVASSRLYGKVLLEVAGKPLLAHMVERLNRCELLDQIVIACPNTPENYPIVELAQNLGVGLFRGSEEDVLGRVLGAAQSYDVDVIVELTGDCPLIDPELVDDIITTYMTWEDPLHFCSNSRDAAPTLELLAKAYPRGQDVRVFPTKVLSQVDRLTSNPADREHVSLYIWEHLERFPNQLWVPAWSKFQSDVRLTLDTPDDLKLIRLVFESLYPANPTFGLLEILALLAVRPELQDINRHVEQKATR